jgi:type IV secretory pathway VirD2 relaxase
VRARGISPKRIKKEHGVLKQRERALLIDRIKKENGVFEAERALLINPQEGEWGF